MNICFKMSEGQVFNYRVAAIITYKDHLLLQSDDECGFWVLPGGRCMFGEGSLEATKRELLEELNIDFDQLKLAYHVENNFDYDDHRCHELSTIYRQALPEGSGYEDLSQRYNAVETGGTKIHFRWFPIDQLRDLELYPTFLREKSAIVNTEFKLIVHED